MSDTFTLPATATEARTQLDAKLADKDWGARVLNGDVAANKELRELSHKSAESGDDVVAAALALSGKDAYGPGTTSDQRVMASVAEEWRSLGIRDEVTAQFLRGEKVSAAEYELVKNWKTTAMGDQDFVKKFLAGDSVARQKMTIANSVLVNGIKDSAA